MRISPNSPRWRASALASETSAQISGGDLTRVRLASSEGIGSWFGRRGAIPPPGWILRNRSGCRSRSRAARPTMAEVSGRRPGGLRMRTGWAGVLAAVAAIALTGTARAEVLDDNPAAASRAPGQITVFVRGERRHAAGVRLLRRLVHAVAVARRLPGLGPGRGRAHPDDHRLVRARRRRRPLPAVARRRPLVGLVPARALDAVLADGLRAPRQRHPRPLLARGRQRHRGQVLGAGRRLDRRQQHPARPGPDRVRAGRGLAQQRAGRRDRARHRRQRLPQRLQRLGVERLGADPRRDEDPARAGRDRAHAQHDRHLRTRGQRRGALGDLGRRGLVGLEDRPRRGRLRPGRGRRHLLADVAVRAPRRRGGLQRLRLRPRAGERLGRLEADAPAAAPAPAAARVRPRRRPRDRPREARQASASARACPAAPAAPTARRWAPPSCRSRR